MIGYNIDYRQKSIRKIVKPLYSRFSGNFDGYFVVGFAGVYFKKDASV